MERVCSSCTSRERSQRAWQQTALPLAALADESCARLIYRSIFLFPSTTLKTRSIPKNIDAIGRHNFTNGFDHGPQRQPVS